MKRINRIFTLLSILGALSLLAYGCSQDDPGPPVLSTSPITNITQTLASGGGNVTSDGGAAVTARGVCWSTDAAPTVASNKTNDGAGTGSFTSDIIGLRANTTYHIRAYATNSSGTAYGSEITFTTQAGETVTDKDGNTYNTVTIGAQVWMVENLKTTKCNDGTAIPLVTDNAEWATLTTAGYAWNNDDETTYKNTYGALYNWYAVDTGKLCPAGWHVATDAEWTTLTTYLGGESVAGGKLKEAGTTHWCDPNIGATNESGFNGLPGGGRTDVTFLSGCGWGLWWTATEAEATTAFNRVIFDNETVVNRVDNNRGFGMSVRCVKD
jgi:uncharacterized protein (TIGR02145 family)